MKIACPCGELISDSTDNLSNKAHRFADRDWGDFLFADRDVDSMRARAVTLSRSMWQCTACGRICLDDRDHELHWFVPEQAGPPPRLLSSVHGPRWKGSLAGNWRTDRTPDPPGQLWWSCGEDDSGWEEFASCTELERRYHEEFTRLDGADLLRSAFLRVDGRITHDWPPQDAATGP